MGVIPSPKRLASAAVTAQGGLRVAGDDDTKAWAGVQLQLKELFF